MWHVPVHFTERVILLTGVMCSTYLYTQCRLQHNQVDSYSCMSRGCLYKSVHIGVDPMYTHSHLQYKYIEDLQ